MEGKLATEMEINIRQAFISDNILLSEIGKETFVDTFAADNSPDDMKLYLERTYSPEIQSNQIMDPRNLFLLLELNGEIIGYSRLYQGEAPACIQGHQKVEISKFYIRKQWIGKGYSGKLMESTIKTAMEKGFDTIWLDVWEKNPRAIAFYKKWMFLEVGKQKFTLGNDIQNDLLMARTLERRKETQSAVAVGGCAGSES